MRILFWVGIALALLGIALLVQMGLGARKLKGLEKMEADRLSQRLIALNFAGMGFGIIGLICVFISLYVN